MTTDRKKPAWVAWATVVLVGLVMYALSFGPAVAFCFRQRGGDAYAVNFAYRPIFYITAHRPEFRRLLQNYFRACGVKQKLLISRNGIVGWIQRGPQIRGR